MRTEPSDEAWKRASRVAVIALELLAERDAAEAAEAA